MGHKLKIPDLTWAFLACRLLGSPVPEDAGNGLETKAIGLATSVKLAGPPLFIVGAVRVPCDGRVSCMVKQVVAFIVHAYVGVLGSNAR